MIDLLLVAAFACGVIGGWHSGLVAHLTTWGGLLVGMILGVAVAGPLLAALGVSAAAAFPLAVGVVGFAALCGGVLGSVVAIAVAPRVPENMRTRDSAAGAVMASISVVALAWLLLPVMSATPGWGAREVERSALASWLQSWLPQAPDGLAIMGAVVGAERYPSVFQADGLVPDVGAPPEIVQLDPSASAALDGLAVRVEGDACGFRQTGTGIALRDNVVLTNAHVVAGVTSGTQEITQLGRTMSATVLYWDPALDVAVLQARGVRAVGAQLIDPVEGDLAVVAGYAGGGELGLRPGRVGAIVEAIGRDIYDTREVRREVLILAAAVRRGVSGGPVVRPDGTVVGMIFALDASEDSIAYALPASTLRVALTAAEQGPVAVGPCVES